MSETIYGYARVSTREQNEDRQIIALKEMGVPEMNIYLDNGNVAFSLNMQVNAASYPNAKAYIFSIAWIIILLAGVIFLKN